MSTMPTRIEVNNQLNLHSYPWATTWVTSKFQLFIEKKKKNTNNNKKERKKRHKPIERMDLSMRSKSSLFYNIYFKLGSTNNKKKPKTIQRIHTCASSGRSSPNSRTIFACCTVWKICQQQPNTNNNKRKISSLCTVTKNHAGLEEKNNKIFNK